jgi:3-isopropylmalate/(R)-2-methylmalate dehydratase small subunit
VKIKLAIVKTKSIKKYKDIVRGKVWVFPDNVDTDAISPGQYLDDLKATLDHTCETIIKEFPSQVKDGDVIIAGRNFGCGSSRETAPSILQEKGIAAIVAISIARIFYRSSFARALPIIEVDGVSNEFEKGDEIEINIPNAEITNLRTGKKLKGKKIHPLLLTLLKKGGLENQLLDELKKEEK